MGSVPLTLQPSSILLVLTSPKWLVISAWLSPIRVIVSFFQPFQSNDGDPAGGHEGIPTGPAENQAADRPGDVILSHNLEPPWGNKCAIWAASDKTYPSFDVLVLLVGGCQAFAKLIRRATANQTLVLVVCKASRNK